MTTFDPYVRRLAGLVADHDRKLKNLARGPQLAYSSIEDGAINEYAEGQHVSSIGLQFDGTHVAASLSGPTPPQPSTPICVGGHGNLTVRWDGVFAVAGVSDPTIIAPMDFSRVEVHISQTANFDPSTAATFIDALDSPRGGEKVVILPAGTWYARLVTRTLSGKPGPASATGSAVVQVQVVNADIVALDTKISQNTTEINGSKARLTTAEGDLTRAFGQIDTTRALADGKGTVWTQNVAPAAGKHHRWSGVPHESTSEEFLDAVRVRTNLVPGASFEKSQFKVDLWRNLFPNPSCETATGITDVRHNLARNPNFEFDANFYSAANEAAISRVVATTLSGSAHGRITFTGSTVEDSGISFEPLTAWAPSKTYTVSLDVLSDVNRLVKFSAQGGGTVNQSPPKFSLSAGVKTRVSFTFTTTTGAPSQVAVYLLRGDLLLGTVDIDQVQVEEGSVSRPYFDGGTPAGGDFTYGWKGTANASESSQRAPGVARAPGSAWVAAYQSGAHGVLVGSKSLAIRASGGSDDTFAHLDGDAGAMRLGMVAGKTYTILGSVTTPVALTGTGTRARAISFHHRVGTGPYVEARSANGPTTGTGDLRLTVSIPADATEAFIRLYNGSPTPGDTVYWDKVLVVEGNYSGPYFDGATPAAGDFTYAWVAAANDSASVLQGEHPATFGDQAGRKVWQSSQLVVRGKSVAVLAGVPNVDAFAALPSPTGSTVLGGKTYTLMGTIRTTETLPADRPESRWWSLYWHVAKSGGGGYTYTIQPTQTGPGTYALRQTITLPADATTTELLRLYNGSVTPGNVVYWDEVAFIEGTYTGPYFDGDSPDDRRGDLWVHSGEGNKRYRWDPAGNAWVTATDQQVVTAQSTADQALTSANGKTKVFRDTVAPSGNGTTIGDVWWQYTDTTWTQVVGEWFWSGSATGWQKRTLSHQAISAVDIGTLTVVGQATLSDVVADRIAGRTALFMNLDVGRLVAGTADFGVAVMDKAFSNMFSTRRLNAGSVYIGPGSNLLTNPDFKDAGKGWSQGAALSYSSTGGYSGGGSVGIAQSSTQSGTYLGITDTAHRVRLEAGQTYKASAWVRSTAQLDPNHVGLYLRLYNSANAAIFATPEVVNNSQVIAANTWHLLSGQFTVPVGAHLDGVMGVFKQAAHTLGAVTVSDPALQLATDGSLVVDGAINGRTITGPLIQTDAAADKGLKWTTSGLTAYGAGGAQTFSLSAASGDVNLHNGEITTKSAIVENLWTVTSKLGRSPTSVYPNQDIPSLSFRSTSFAAGDLPAFVATRDGYNLLLGSGKSGGATSDIQITRGSVVLSAYDGATAGSSEISLSAATVGGNSSVKWHHYAPQFILDGGSGTTKSKLELNQNLATLSADSRVDLTTPEVRVSARLVAGRLMTGLAASVTSLNYDSGSGVIRPGQWFSTDGAVSGAMGWMGVDNPGDLKVRAPSGRHLILAPNGAGSTVRVEGLLDLYDPPSSTFTANVGISSTPKDRFYRITSKRVSKVNIRDVPAGKAEALLTVNPRLWYDRTQVVERLGANVITEDAVRGPQVPATVIEGQKTRRKAPEAALQEIPGLVAEEVMAAGLGEYVTHANDPVTGDPSVEGVAYDRLWTLLIPLIRADRARIDHLEHLLNVKK